MELGIWTSYYIELSPEDAIRELKKNGINSCELSDEHGHALISRGDNPVETGKAFRDFIKQEEMSIPQAHLPLNLRICQKEEDVDRLCKWIDMYEAIGIKNMVLHCDELYYTEMTAEEKIRRNVEQIKKVVEYIKEKDIYICLENLRPDLPGLVSSFERVEDLQNVIEMVGSPRFGICLDTSHLNLTVKHQREFILKAGDMLRALHISDNRETDDDHMMPYTNGSIDFTEIVGALKEIGYDGIFNLEIPGERMIPMELKGAKIDYIKACYNYLMSV